MSCSSFPDEVLVDEDQMKTKPVIVDSDGGATFLMDAVLTRLVTTTTTKTDDSFICDQWPANVLGVLLDRKG